MKNMEKTVICVEKGIRFAAIVTKNQLTKDRPKD
jgi:hypothetical protein